jgi:hypothetical protein
MLCGNPEMITCAFEVLKSIRAAASGKSLWNDTGDSDLISIEVIYTAWALAELGLNQLRVLCKLTTEPTMISAGGFMLAALALCSMSVKHPVTTFCSAVVADWTNAICVLAGMPCSINFWQMIGNPVNPI